MVGWTDFHSTQVVVPAIVTINPGDWVWSTKIREFGHKLPPMADCNGLDLILKELILWELHIYTTNYDLTSKIKKKKRIICTLESSSFSYIFGFK